MIYSYDGTFFGYLSAVFDAWHDGLAQVEDICPDSRLGLVFSEQRFVPVDDGKARRILDALLANVGPSPAITYTMPSWPKRKGAAWPSCSICAGRSGISTSFYTISARNPSGRSASGPAGPVMNAISS